MLVRRLTVPLGVLALLIGGCGSGNGGGNTTSANEVKGTSMRIAGPWTGQLIQAGLPPFKVAVWIFNGTGTVAYTGIDCAGDWKLAGGGDPGPKYVFTETINQGAGGACKGTGTVHLDHHDPDSIIYRFQGGGVTSEGILRPARLPVWAAIFRRAGVQVGGSSAPCPKGAPVCGVTVTATAPDQTSK